MATKRKKSTKTTAKAPHTTRIDLAAETRGKVVELLQQQLSDAIDLQGMAKQAHWNVKGPSFIALHELFDDIYAAVAEHVDELAERLVALGGVAHGTVRMTAKRTSLPNYPADIATGRAHVDAMATALAAFGKNIRAAIEVADDLDDTGTEDLLTGISRDIDKWLWFVEAHLQAEN